MTQGAAAIRSSLRVFGIGAAVSANWVLTMPSDLSEVDLQSNKLPNPYGWQFRLFLILLCPICLVFAKFTAAKSCPAEWRILPMNRTEWGPNGPQGDDYNFLEHWGICVAANLNQTVMQAGCPGGPSPSATEMQWLLSSTGGGQFRASSVYSKYLNGPTTGTVNLSPIATTATTWQVG